jgi:hypothetical protein
LTLCGLHLQTGEAARDADRLPVDQQLVHLVLPCASGHHVDGRQFAHVVPLRRPLAGEQQFTNPRR